jgi:hypothetical protein
MDRVAVTMVTTVTGVSVVPLDRVEQEGDAREDPRCLIFKSLRATRGEGMTRFSVTAVTAVT